MTAIETVPDSERRGLIGALPPRLRIGVLQGAEREFFGNAEVEALYDAAIARAQALGATILPFDYAPFREAAALGFRITEHWSVMATVEHMSNAGLCGENRGLTNFGGKLGYTF